MSTDPREFEHPIDGTGGTVTPEAIEAAQIKPWPKSPHVISINDADGQELFAILTDGTVRGSIENAGPAAQLFMTELRGMTEVIAAQAKAEALREAAEACAPDYETTDTRSVAKWLRARAATIEGKSE